MRRIRTSDPLHPLVILVSLPLGAALLLGGCEGASSRDPASGRPEYTSPRTVDARGLSLSEVPLASHCEGQTVPGVDGPLPTFNMQTVSIRQGAAYMFPTDLDADGFPEFLLTSLAEGLDPVGAATGGSPVADGGAYVLRRRGGAPHGTLGIWETVKEFDKSEKVGWPNASEHWDVDGDGIADWIIGAGFLLKPVGKIVWMKGASDGTFGAVRYINVPDPSCWYHMALSNDIDADGDNDFVTSCHVGDTTNLYGPSRLEWFENQGGGTFTPHAIADGGGALIALRDLDGDGDQDIVAPQFFGPEALVWFEQTGQAGSAWQKHLINDNTGRGFVVKFADMNGDGKTDLVYGNHNNDRADDPENQTMGIYWFDIPASDTIRNLTHWDDRMHVVYEGFEVAPDMMGRDNKDSAGAPGMINVGDIDGDCDIDVTASGDGDLGLYVFVQQSQGFDSVVLSHAINNVNSGEQHMVDLDGDGDLDILWAVFGPALLPNSRVHAFMQE